MPGPMLEPESPDVTERIFEGQKWYLVAVHYPSALQARRAWERVQRKSLGGAGTIRMAPAAGGQALASGAPEGVYPVVVTTDKIEVASKARRVLSDGTPWTPTDDFADAMILRRLRVLAEHTGETGHVVFRRPENRGATMDYKGNVHEPEPGRG